VKRETTVEGRIPPVDETLEDRLGKLERDVCGLRDLCRAQRPLFAINIICLSGECDRLNAALMIADGAKAIGQEVNIFLTPWAKGTSYMRKVGFPNGRSGIRKILAWVLPPRLDWSSPPEGNSNARRKFFERKQVRGAKSRDLMDLIDQARERGVRIYECGPPPRLGGPDPVQPGDFGSSDWCSVSAMLSRASRGETTLVI